MNATKGLFPIINAIIHESQEDGCVAIEKEHIEEELRKRYDISQIDREFLEYIFLDMYIGVALSQNGYYSPFRGKRIFVNPEKLEVMAMLGKIEGNLQKDLFHDQQKIKKLMDIIKEQKKAMENQLTFDETFEETGEYQRTPSEEELLEMLEELCKPAEERRQS